MEEVKKSGRGGARPGAGRPRGINIEYRKITFNLPVDFIELLKRVSEATGESQSATVRNAVRRMADDLGL